MKLLENSLNFCISAWRFEIGSLEIVSQVKLIAGNLSKRDLLKAVTLLV